jgi:hypothetical protein
MEESERALNAPPIEEDAANVDLAARLARLRSRMDAEGRTAAVERIDAEIKRAQLKKKAARKR